MKWKIYYEFFDFKAKNNLPIDIERLLYDKINVNYNCCTEPESSFFS